MQRRKNICEACLRSKKILSFTHAFEPVLTTCFYCRKMNTDGFYITEENDANAQKVSSQEKSTQVQEA